MHLRGEAFATHSVAVEGGQAKAAEAAGCDTVGEFLSPLIKDGQAKAAEAAGCETASEHKQACRRANLPLPGAGVSCALVCCRFLQVRGANCLSFLQVLQCQKSADCPRQDLSSHTGNHLGACSVQLSAANPALAAEWHPTKNGKLLPFDVSAGSNLKAWWAGSCGHDWEAIIQSRHLGGFGCQQCQYLKQARF